MTIEMQACRLSKENKSKLRAYSKRYSLPITTLVGIALDKELEREEPFAWECKLPDEKFVEYAYANEALEINKWMRLNGIFGFPLHLLCLIRRDMHIEDMDKFLGGMQELKNANQVEEILAIDSKKAKSGFSYPQGTILFRPVMTTAEKNLAKSKRKEAEQYDKYVKLKEKFGGM